jgi:hypothetical protein
VIINGIEMLAEDQVLNELNILLTTLFQDVELDFV